MYCRRSGGVWDAPGAPLLLELPAQGRKVNSGPGGRTGKKACLQLHKASPASPPGLLPEVTVRVDNPKPS